MKMIGKTVHVLFIFISCAVTSSMAIKCTIPSSARDKPFPDVLKNLKLYTMRTELNTKYLKSPLESTQNQSSFFTEYYQEAFGEINGRLDFFDGNVDRVTIFGSKYVTYIEKNNCSVIFKNHSMMNGQDLSFWGFYNPDGSTYGPSSILKNAFRNYKSKAKLTGKPMFIQQTTVMGMTVNLWQACFTRDLKVTYAVSSDGTTPVQVVLNGKAPGLLESYDVEQTYNFMSFVKDVDISVFFPPEGIGCTGMKPVSNFPSFPPIFAFKAELFHRSHNYETRYIDYAFLIYDYPQNITTFTDVKHLEDTIQIHDFNTGVAYSIRTDYSQQFPTPDCHIMPISEIDNFDWDMNIKGDPKLMPMLRDPKHFFNLGAKFYSLGQSWERGIEVDVYEAVKFNYTLSLLKHTYYKVVITYKFSTHYWKEYSDKNFTYAEQRFPVRMSVIGYDKNLKKVNNMTVNYFDFDVGNEGESLSHIYSAINSCFHFGNDSTNIKFSFSRHQNDVQIARNYDGRFSQAVRNYFTKILHISPLRIPRVIVHYDNDFIYATVQFTRRVSPTKRFHRYGNWMYIPKNAVKFMVHTKGDCAEKCLNDNKCKSMFLCYVDSIYACYTYSKVISGPGDIGPSTTPCPFYIKSVFATDVGNSKLSDLVAKIAKIMKTSVSISFPTTVNGKTQTVRYDAYEYQQDALTRSNISMRNNGADMEMMIKNVGLKSEAADVAAMKIKDVTHCEDACKQNKACESMSYCMVTQKCRLTSHYIDKITTGKNGTAKYLKFDTGCDLFSKPYMLSFEKEPYAVSLEPADKSIKVANTEGACAKACVDEKTFDCQSFEWCPKHFTCQLYKASYLDNPSKSTIKTKEPCSFYRRTLMSGFQDNGEVKRSGYSGHAIERLSLYECYQACQNDGHPSCNSFDYCPKYNKQTGDNLCIVRHTTHPVKHPADKLQYVANCRSYGRMSPLYSASKPKKSASTQKKKANSASWTPGALGGLCIGLLALGLFAGIVAMLATSKYRQGKLAGSNDMSISFSRHRDTEDS